MYYLNKIVWVFFNPLTIALLCCLLGIVLIVRSRRRIGLSMLTGGVVWLWLWSTPLMCRWVGKGLEDEWPIVLAEDAPCADAIVLLGGGIGSNTNVYPYAEMASGSDRVWHAARLYKAKKAPVIIATGREGAPSHVPLLVDLGVSRADIIIEDEARNTEENARLVERTVENLVRSEGNDSLGGAATRKSVLLVTSAYHMRRSVLMFKKYAPGLDVVAAATDYEATVCLGRPFGLGDLLPSADMLSTNTCCFKEYIGYWGYRLFR